MSFVSFILPFPIGFFVLLGLSCVCSDCSSSCSNAFHGDAGGTFTAHGNHELISLLLQVLGNFIPAGEGHASSTVILLNLIQEVGPLLHAEHTVLVGVSSLKGCRHLGHPFRLDWILSGGSAIGSYLCSVLLGKCGWPGTSPLNNSLKVFGHLANQFSFLKIMIL